MMKPVYTIDDLTSREVLDAGADQPARLAVIGYPVAHSASPQMHQPALDTHDIDVRYIRLELTSEQLPEAFERMRQLDFIGCNVTVPHKFDAMNLCDVVADEAKALGAVNTVCFGVTTHGYNTDGPGFAKAIESSFGKSLTDLKIAIVGAGGGAGQAIATQCTLMGVPELTIINRTIDKVQALAERLRPLNTATTITALSLSDKELASHCLGADLIVNTTSIGLKEGDPSILPQNCLKPDHLVYDTIYKPAITPLLQLANETGCQTANGISMLIHQGAISFQHWFPNTDPLPVMQKALG